MAEDLYSGASSLGYSTYGDVDASSILGYPSDGHTSHSSFNTAWDFQSSSPVPGLTLPSSHRTSSPFQNSIESRVQKLETENSALRGEKNAYKAAYHELVQAVPALIASTSNAFGLTGAPPGHTGPRQLPPLKEPLPPFIRKKFPLVKFWDRGDFFKKSQGVSNTGGPSAHGKSLASQGVNVSGKFIEEGNGKVVDGYRVTAILKCAQCLWFLFLEYGRAPSMWSQASADVVALYHDEMGRQFPELRLCSEN
ncbi:hypothetical protein K438DRAFT_1965739 [Mycena galopus ATCC 62051]|nr:hypothetical protein K438DRAFT_1965739 [Mycena galopus ATCC 62051]